MRCVVIVIFCLFPFSPAIADSEPNNTWQTAELLSRDSSVKGVQSDNDWYKINITSNQAIRRILIDLKFSHDSGDIDVSVYGDDFVVSDPAGPLPGLFRNTSASTTSDHEFVDANVSPNSPETYYILVSGENRSNSYTLTWTELTGPDDGFEENDSQSASKSITEGAVAFGVQSDDDWYSIRVTPGNRHIVASLRFFKAGLADLNLELTDASGTLIASSVNTAGINELIDLVVPAQGTYHLHVYGDNGGDGYALDWSGMNEAPQAIANTVSTTENMPYHFAVSDFTFSDNERDSLISATLGKLSLGGGTLTYSNGTPVDNGGTLAAGQLNTLVYTPPADSFASPMATFDFTVNDADTGTVAAQMNINVTEATTLPVSSTSSGATAPVWLLILVMSGWLRRKMRG